MLTDIGPSAEPVGKTLSRKHGHPVAITLSHLENGLEVSYSGPLVAADINRVLELLLSHPRPFALEFYLGDFSGSGPVQLSPEDVQHFAGSQAPALECLRDLAIVIVTPQPELYPMALSWQEMLGAVASRTKVARSRGEALAWLEELGIQHGLDASG